jgi:MFS family permease
VRTLESGTEARGEPAVESIAPSTGDWPSPARAWYALIVLTVALMVATIDRGILTLLVAPIKTRLGLSDTQFTVLHGWAFVSVYALLGLPIARYADRHSRRLIIGLGIAFWSLATAVCGFATSFPGFFAARAAVGAGESAFAPATYSILQDSFPPAKLPRVFAILAIGFSYGGSFGVILGAALLGLASGAADWMRPLFGTLETWQMVLVLCALPGLVLALLMSTVHEPRRRGFPPGARPAEALPIAQVMAYFREHRATYLPMFIAMGIKAMLTFGSGFWIPELMRRTFEWKVTRTALMQGTLGLIVAPLGLMLGSWLAERFQRRGRDDANLRVLQLATVCAIPTAVCFPLLGDPHAVMAGWALNLFVISIGIAPANAALQMITPNPMRGQIRAAYQFVFNVVGFGAGSFCVALFTDHVFHDEASLRYSLASVAAIIGPVAALLTWYGMKPYAACVARSRSWT